MNAIVRRFTAMLLSLLMFFSASAFSLIQPMSANAKSVNYNDYQSGQYWSNDMLWAIENGLISGYLNVKQPGNKNSKVVGNWLVPQGELTEAQMLSVVLKQSNPNEMKTTKPIIPAYWASVPYQLAEKYELPVNGSLKNRVPASEVVTRGDLARILATLYLKRWVSVEEAVDFMYKANLSDGFKVNGKVPRNFDSYETDLPLKRAHIVSFLKRNDAFIKSGKVITIIPAESGTEGLKLLYGNHAYGCMRQSEYDEVMNRIQKELETHTYRWSYEETDESRFYYEAYFKGERAIKDRGNPESNTFRNRQLYIAESRFRTLVDAGWTRDQVYEIDNLKDVKQDMVWGIRDSWNTFFIGGAYALLHYKVRKHPLQDAMLLAAILDSKGFTTAILSKTEEFQATTYVKMNDRWFDVESYKEVKIEDLVTNGTIVRQQPTDGTYLKQW